MQPAHADGRFRAALDVTLDLRLASVGSRALAQAVDSVILTALMGGAGLLCLGAWGMAAAAGQADAGAWALAAFVVLIFALQSGYFLVFEQVWHGQTPGKRWVGLRVVTDDGAVPGLAACTIRNLLRTIDMLPGGYTLGVVAALFSARGKRLGDLAAGTVVVVEEPPSAAPARRWSTGLAPDEVRALEAWFARAPELLPERRDALGARLLAALRARHPELRPVDDVPAADALAALFPAEG